MSELMKCPECGSKDLIPNLPITAITPAGAGDLAIQVLRNPSAIIFKGREIGMVRATVCGVCGHVRLGICNPNELFSAYQQQAQADSPS